MAYYIPANKDYNLDGSINFGGSVTNHISKAIEENNNKNLLFEPNKALVTDENGLIDTSRTTSKEISFVSGARRNIQQQIDELDRITLELGKSTSYTGGENIEITEDNVINCTIKDHLYTSFAELGFTSAPTPKQFFDKMEAGSVAILDETQLSRVAPDRPDPYGKALITIYKYSDTRGRAIAHSTYEIQEPKSKDDEYQDWFIDFHTFDGNQAVFWQPLSFKTTKYIESGIGELGFNDGANEQLRGKNVASRAAIKVDGWEHSVNRGGAIVDLENTYRPAVGFRKNKDYNENFTGDYNWSIGTWPANDTATNNDTRLHFVASDDNYDNRNSTDYCNYRDYWFDINGRTNLKTTFGEYWKDCLVFTDGSGTINCSTQLKKSNIVTTPTNGFTSNNRLAYIDKNGKLDTVSMSYIQLTPTDGDYGSSYLTMGNIVIIDFHGCSIGELEAVTAPSSWANRVFNSPYCSCSTNRDGRGESCYVRYNTNTQKFYSPASNNTRVWGQMTLILM